MRRPAFLAAAVIAGLVSCTNDLGVPVVEIPEGSDQFSLAPSLLNYELVDSSSIQKIKLTWLPLEPFAGSNCIALSPTTPAQDAGTFVFARFGANIGRMQQIVLPADTDTVLGILLSGHEGTHGTYTISPSGAMTLNWADAQADQRSYFDPAATIRILGDTIFSDIQKSDHGDSAHVEWHVRWLRGVC